MLCLPDGAYHFGVPEKKARVRQASITGQSKQALCANMRANCANRASRFLHDSQSRIILPSMRAEAEGKEKVADW